MTEKTSPPVALVTGASRGLGAAIAEYLAPEFQIIALARTVGALEALDDRIVAKGGQSTLAPMDINNDAAMQQLCHGIYTRWGHIDLWVHTAVFAGPLSPAPYMAEKDFTQAVETNVNAFARLVRYVAPLLQKSSVVVNFADQVSGDPFYGNYGATKAAQQALAKSWQAETAETGPKVLELTPEPMATATRARFFPGEDTSALARPMQEAERLMPGVLATWRGQS